MKVEDNEWLIADNPGIMSWCGNSDITWADIELCAMSINVRKCPEMT